MGPDEPRVQVELAAVPEAARQARAVVDRVAAGMPGDVGFRARVVVNELVANSVEHAVGAPSDRVGLTVLRSGSVIRVEVLDRGEPFDDAPRVVPGRATSGRGLRLVDALVDRWGVEHEDGNLVWFEIDEHAGGDHDPRSTPLAGAATCRASARR
jgi:anti-sigma regulatory factor (Ser/Thr protein kinase)